MNHSLYIRLVTVALTVLAAGCNLPRSGARLEERSGDSSLDIDNATNAPDPDASTNGVAFPQDSGLVSWDSGLPVGLPVSMDARDVVIGRYAERRAFRTIQRIRSAIFRDDVRVLTTTYALVEIQKMGSGYRLRENACRVVVKNEGSFTSLDVSIDDQVPQSIPQIESNLRVKEVAGNITWVRPLTSAAVGWIPNGPNDSLPTTANDARVRDSDGDGNPGVSAYVKANLAFTNVEGNLYLTQWNRARYVGVRRADGVLEGENFEKSEQNVVGSDNPMLANMSPPIAADRDRDENRVIMVPLTMPMNCQTMLGQLDTLFP
jgi:hypothetical protein